MKHLKKMMALALAGAMTLSMSMAAFAEGGNDGPVTITIQNGEYDTNYYTKGADEIKYADHTYTAAQILAATAYDKTTGEYSGLTWALRLLTRLLCLQH